MGILSFIISFSLIMASISLLTEREKSNKYKTKIKIIILDTINILIIHGLSDFDFRTSVFNSFFGLELSLFDSNFFISLIII